MSSTACPSVRATLRASVKPRQPEAADHRVPRKRPVERRRGRPSSPGDLSSASGWFSFISASLYTRTHLQLSLSHCTGFSNAVRNSLTNPLRRHLRSTRILTFEKQVVESLTTSRAPRFDPVSLAPSDVISSSECLKLQPTALWFPDQARARLQLKYGERTNTDPKLLADGRA